jgi:hypothetical protein
MASLAACSSAVSGVATNGVRHAQTQAQAPRTVSVVHHKVLVKQLVTLRGRGGSGFGWLGPGRLHAGLERVLVRAHLAVQQRPQRRRVELEVVAAAGQHATQGVRSGTHMTGWRGGRGAFGFLICLGALRASRKYWSTFNLHGLVRSLLLSLS